MANEAIAEGMQKALLKVRGTPSLLAGIIKDVAAGRDSFDDPAYMLPVPKPDPAIPPPTPAASAAPPSATAPPAPSPAKIAADAAEFMAKAREDFVAKASSTVAELRSLEQG